jgi:small ligand-binding sensory domain FIST
LQGGLYAGVVIDEYKPRFGRDDFLIRNVVGVDADLGCIALADFVRVGQTVRMHVRDKKTASEDLALLMDAQRLYDPPDGALLITCNGRGERTFGVRNHDVAAVQRAFTQDRAGPDAAGAGLYLDPSAAAPIPLAGFHAAGEIGPVGNSSFLHGQTACVAMFRGA